MKPLLLGVGAAFAISAIALTAPAFSAEDAVRIPAPAVDQQGPAVQQTALFAGGCFWGVQGVFQHVKGVTSAVSGYAGGRGPTNYEAVGTGTTGYAETVRVSFDPKQVSYGKLLQIYFSVAHDPTQLNRQDPDSGTQYRSAVFPLNADQKRVAEAYIGQLNRAHVYSRPIVTRTDPAQGFVTAEGYHQNYLTLHPDSPYIAMYDLPKVAALKQLFPGYYQAKPVLVGKSRT